jgi:hypothetical protein
VTPTLMVTETSSDLWVHLHQTAQHHIPEDGSRQSHRPENTKSHKTGPVRIYICTYVYKNSETCL